MEIDPSAGNHGVPKDDLVHAVEHELVSGRRRSTEDPGERPRHGRDLLEVIVLVLEHDRLIAVHAMRLRRQFYELLPGEEGLR